MSHEQHTGNLAMNVPQFSDIDASKLPSLDKMDMATAAEVMSIEQRAHGGQGLPKGSLGPVAQSAAMRNARHGDPQSVVRGEAHHDPISSLPPVSNLETSTGANAGDQGPVAAHVGSAEAGSAEGVEAQERNAQVPGL